MRCLIANRGEIASRLNRTLKKMGLVTIGLASYWDRNLPYVSELDFVIYLPDMDPKTIFLDEDFLVSLCKKFKIDCLHPGYGFLSENASFAEKLSRQNIIFIGPSARALHLLGSKLAIKELAKKLSVPILESQVLDNLSQSTIQFPAIFKSAEGGGGRGMRIVRTPQELEEALVIAQKEALVTKSGQIFLEPYLQKFKHLEFQVVVSQSGDTSVLVERDCTVQRKFQKIIEETPCPILRESLRNQMQDYCRRIAEYLKEPSIFTFEFLVTEDRCYLSEVNPRLQVEHTITEEIYKIDLVELQTRIALGQSPQLPNPSAYSGSAIQLRVYAEHPRDFSPQAGLLTELQFPLAPSRLELSYKAGNALTYFYDSLLAKLIEHGPFRSAVINKLIQIVEQAVIKGLKSNLKLLSNILQSEEFNCGSYDNNIVEASLARGIHFFEAPDEIKDSNWEISQIQYGEIAEFSFLPGLVVGTSAKTGAQVIKGQEILQIESMKMIYSIKASKQGVLELFVAQGDAIEKNQLLFKIK